MTVADAVGKQCLPKWESLCEKIVVLWASIRRERFDIPCIHHTYENRVSRLDYFIYDQMWTDSNNSFTLLLLLRPEIN